MTTMIRPFLLSLAILAGFAVQSAQAEDIRIATVAGGCFWCVESDFESVRGVSEVISGYTGGTTENPSYRDVSSKRTGHFEAVQIQYDADQVSLAQIYHLFFRSIDPTDPGGQFCDRGNPYRTAIFVSGANERREAEAAKAKAEATLGQPIVTEIRDLGPFYRAEDEHQDFYKSEELTLRRVVPSTRAEVYKYYRQSCGRDARVRALWGDEAIFAAQH